MMYSVILLLAILQLVSSTNADQRCDAPRFSCEYNDPCDPECVPGQGQYPGRGDRVWVECVDGQCTENKCPRRTTWNQGNQRCQGSNGLEARCAFSSFDCADRNPCNPTLCEGGILEYPGASPRKYVKCDLQGGCSEEQCPKRQEWDQEEQQCKRRNPPVDNRCNAETFDCEDTNPCSPERCTPGKEFYPAHDIYEFIQCESGSCYVLFCASGTQYDDSVGDCLSV